MNIKNQPIKVLSGVIFALSLASNNVFAANVNDTCNGKRVTHFILGSHETLDVASEQFGGLEHHYGSNSEPYSSKIPSPNYYLWKDTPGDDVLIVELSPGAAQNGSPWNINETLIIDFSTGNDSVCFVTPSAGKTYVLDANYIKSDAAQYSLSAYGLSSTGKVSISSAQHIDIETTSGSSGKGATIDIEDFSFDVKIKTGNGDDKINIATWAPHVNDAFNHEKDFVYVSTGKGNDSVFSNSNVDLDASTDVDVYVNGGEGDDNLQVWNQANVFIVGGKGHDEVDGGGAYNFLVGGISPINWENIFTLGDISSSELQTDYDPTDDSDSIYAAGGKNLLLGSNGNDTIWGGVGNDYVRGYDGNDFIAGDKGNDTLKGDDGDDTIYGGDNSDKLYGGNGYDALYGEGGNDTLDGGSNTDLCEGSSGSNTKTSCER